MPGSFYCHVNIFKTLVNGRWNLQVKLIQELVLKTSSMLNTEKFLMRVISIVLGVNGFYGFIITNIVNQSSTTKVLTKISEENSPIIIKGTEAWSAYTGFISYLHSIFKTRNQCFMTCCSIFCIYLLASSKGVKQDSTWITFKSFLYRTKVTSFRLECRFFFAKSTVAWNICSATTWCGYLSWPHPRAEKCIEVALSLTALSRQLVINLYSTWKQTRAITEGVQIPPQHTQTHIWSRVHNSAVWTKLQEKHVGNINA